MKGYKAFEKGLICRGKQYAENTVFEEEQATICKNGMHFCKEPLEVLEYYPLVDDNGNMSEFAEVEALDKALTDDNKKYCTKKLKIGAKLTLSNFITVSATVMYENITTEVNAAVKGKRKTTDKIQSGGSYSTLAGGDNSTLAGGDNSTLAGGDNSKLAGGYNSKLAGGYNSKLAGGDNSKLAGGSYSKLAGGSYSTLAGGEHSVIVGDNGSIAKGKIGALLVIVERGWKGNEYIIKSFGAELVDGIRIKADTFYKLENGEFVEA